MKRLLVAAVAVGVAVAVSAPPPGAKFATNTKIDFGVVRIDTEECP